MIHQIKLTAPSKKRTIWTCISSAAIFLFMYVGIFHQYHKIQLDTGLLLLLGFHSLMHLKHLWIDASKMNWTRHLLPVMVWLILSLLAIATYGLRKNYYANQLSNHGYTFMGKVEFVNTLEFPVFGRYAVVHYKFDNRNFTQRINNKEQKLTAGETVMLRLSTQHPKIIEVVDANSFIR